MKSRIPSVWRSIRELCVGLGRAVVLVAVADRYGGAFHQDSTPAPAVSRVPSEASSRPTSTCSIGLSVSSLTFSISPSSSHFDFSPAKVEIRISSIR